MSEDFGFDDEKTKKIENQHYDEAVELSDQASEIMSGEEEEQQGSLQGQPQKLASAAAGYNQDSKVPIPQGAYNPSDYNNLNVAAEVKELFKYIDRYKAPTIELEAKLKPFIPEYIPSIGEVDAFLKMLRPDGQNEILGLVTLDEPALNQSKKAKLDLMMREYLKVANRGKQITIHSIENADKNPKEISAWVNDVSEIHKKKQPPSVSYTKPFPDIDALMQVWPQEMEDFLSECQLPGEQIDLPLDKYCQLVCNLLDIPVHQTTNNRNLIESLHVLFTLFSEFKANQHFQQQGDQQLYQ